MEKNNLTIAAIGGTLFIWLVSMALSYESQVEFALSIGMTSTIFGVSKAYAFPILTDLLIGVSAMWSLLATLKGWSNLKYRASMFIFGMVTIWFNTHSVNISKVDYTTIFAVSWIPLVVIISTEMLLGYFDQQVKSDMTNFSREADMERRIIELEVKAEMSPYLALTVADEAKNSEDARLPVTSIQKAQQAKQAKYQENLAVAKELFMEGKSPEYVASQLMVSEQTARNYRTVLNGSISHVNTQ